MPVQLKPPGGDKTVAASIFLIGSLVCFVLGAPHLQPYLLGLSAIFLVCGAGLWLDQQWARWFTIFSLIAFSIFSAEELVRKGFNWVRLGCLLAPIWTAWQVWKDFAPSKHGGEEEDTDQEKKPMISLALLLREPRYLEAKILAQIVSSAWGETYTAGGDGDENQTDYFVAGESPFFLIKSPRGMFMVHNFSRPYFNDVEGLVGKIKELRLRKAIEDHNAWMAVDLMDIHEEHATSESIYPWIAKLVAELAGPDCSVPYQPETQKINVWDASLEEKLRGPDALQEFAAPAHPPVIRIDDDDPRMKAAVAEARSKWPEFVEAFKRRYGENFSIKAPITRNGNTEFIWVEVTGLEPEYIHGTIGNDPVNLEGLKLGDQVEIPLKDLNDWMFLRNGTPIGLFTAKVFEETQQGKATDA